MLVAYSERHVLHRLEAEVLLGMPRGSVERPERAERIREALEGDEGFQLMEPTDHGVGPIEAVHHPGLVRFLEGAWSEWASGQDASQLIPDTVLPPRPPGGHGALAGAPLPRGAPGLLQDPAQPFSLA